jgi:gamma-glutamylcyclotransferase (GGCT)/AIG2-like uncharacterized protein YtfP
VTVLPLFLYGTLRDADILAAVLGRIVPETDLVTAHAPDYAAVYFPGQVYPALVARPGSVAPGLLLAPTADDLAALDAFEGDEYRRGPLLAVTAEGPVTADVYWPDIAVAPSALDWTLENWSREHKPLVLARETALAEASRLGTARR